MSAEAGDRGTGGDLGTWVGTGDGPVHGYATDTPRVDIPGGVWFEMFRPRVQPSGQRRCRGRWMRARRRWWRDEDRTGHEPVDDVGLGGVVGAARTIAVDARREIDRGSAGNSHTRAPQARRSDNQHPNSVSNLHGPPRAAIATDTTHRSGAQQRYTDHSVRPPAAGDAVTRDRPSRSASAHGPDTAARTAIECDEIAPGPRVVHPALGKSCTQWNRSWFSGKVPGSTALSSIRVGRPSSSPSRCRCPWPGRV